MSLYLYALALVASVWLLFKWQNSHWSRRGVRGPAGIPLFGNMFQFFMLRKHFGEVYDEMYQSYSNAAYVGFYKFGTPTILVRSVDLMRTVLADNFGSFADNDVQLEPHLDPLFMKNPFFSFGDAWRKMRGQFGPIFTASKVRLAVPMVADVCDKFVRYVDGRLDEEHEAKTLFTMFTVEAVASCAFGIEAQTFTNPRSEFMQNAQAVFATTPLQMFRFTIVQFMPIFGRVFKMSLLPNEVDTWIRSVVDHVTAQRSKSKEQRHDFLQSLLDARDKCPTRDADYDENSLAGHSLSFLTEGYETSSTTMTYCLYELARNPDVQRRLQAEVDEVFGRGGRITDDGFQRLAYLETVVYETLRMHSVVFSMNRVCTKDFKLPPQFAGEAGNGVIIPKGTPVILPIYSVHKDPAVFDNPTEFRPERFTEAGRAGRHRYSFLGFGEGPRICPGIRLGLLQVKAAIATTMLNYNVRIAERTVEPLTFCKGGIIKTCTDGIWMRFERR